MFSFSDYLKICREEKGVTQNELVEELVELSRDFESLDNTTMSRWERGVSKPSLTKQTSIIRYFSDHFGRIYPFIEHAERIDIEQSFCALGFSKLLGRHKLVMNFPTQHMDKKSFATLRFNDSQLQSNAVIRNLFMIKELYGKDLCPDSHLQLAKNPANYCAVCEYDGEYYGHFFALKLKPDIFKKMMAFQYPIEALCQENIAAEDEAGSYYFFGFFGMSDLVISMLWINFYSWLIKEQDLIQEAGALIASKEGIMIAKNMNIECVASVEMGERTYHSFVGTPQHMLIAENVVKMLFNPENCPEE